MARQPRNWQPDGVFHVTARGVGRIPIYRDDDDRRFFLALLALVVAKTAPRFVEDLGSNARKRSDVDTHRERP